VIQVNRLEEPQNKKSRNSIPNNQTLKDKTEKKKSNTQKNQKQKIIIIIKIMRLKIKINNKLEGNQKILI
jgi:hypothetical protein